MREWAFDLRDQKYSVGISFYSLLQGLGGRVYLVIWGVMCSFPEHNWGILGGNVVMFRRRFRSRNPGFVLYCDEKGQRLSQKSQEGTC